ncbi:hypothetical protein QAD02_002092 [Eretmocerus hayati]|uniref:Uncharacterized protein n=1 Tax=Eretmocerus hayati TaxID=131215 RepID=A0ACC2NJ48_9HYME|nr:hypothetical protein QAD02_002092 [Eretmocerus hayati]
MSRSKCLNNPNKFCYVCGSVIFKGESRVLSESFISLYFQYFKRDVSDVDKNYVPDCVCASSYTTIRLWSTGTQKRHNRANRKLIEYPDFTSSKRPLPHGPDFPVPPAPWSRQEESREDCDSGTDTIDFVEAEDNPARCLNPVLFDQESLNDFVRDLGLTEEKAELCGSSLQEGGMLAPGVIFYQYRYREKESSPFFMEENSLVYCHNIPGLMSTLGANTYESRRENKLFVQTSLIKWSQ